MKMKKGVLMVEDDELTAKTTQDILEELGYPVVAWAKTGEEGVEKAEELLPDLVLMDIELPGDMDGIDAANEIRSRYNIPIIYLTAHAEEQIVERAKISGPLGYLVKPIAKRDLFTAIEMAVYRQKTEEILETTLQELERSNQLKDLFNDIMRHDLMNKIGAMRGSAEVLGLDETDEQKQQLLDIIMDAAGKTISIIDNANKLSRVTSVRVLDKESTNIKEIIDNVVGEIAPFLESQGMAVENNLPSGLSIEANPLIEDVFLNLLTNAAKYASEGKKAVVDYVDEGKTAKITITDYGQGIPNEYKDGIFERFTRRHKEGIQGHGLGLAIVKHVVGLHAGKVWVEDNPKGGSVFCVSLPKTVEERKGRILVVDDSRLNRAITKEALEQEGHEVMEAESGEDALEILKKVKPDLVLLDVMMPGISGWDVCAWIKSSPKLHDVPVVMLTTKARDEDILKSIQLDAAAHITKPVESEKLLDTVRCLLEN